MDVFYPGNNQPVEKVEPIRTDTQPTTQGFKLITREPANANPVSPYTNPYLHPQPFEEGFIIHPEQGEIPVLLFLSRDSGRLLIIPKDASYNQFETLEGEIVEIRDCRRAPISQDWKEIALLSPDYTYVMEVEDVSNSKKPIWQWSYPNSF